MALLEPQLARTIRALELMGEMYTAHCDVDTVRYDALVQQAVDEAGADTLLFLRGGMTIGEVPQPYHPEWHPYLDDLRARLAAQPPEDNDVDDHDDDPEDEDSGEWHQGECDHCFGDTVDSPLGPITCACTIGQGAERDEDCHCGPVPDDQIGLPCRRCRSSE